MTVRHNPGISFRDGVLMGAPKAKTSFNCGKRMMPCGRCKTELLYERVGHGFSWAALYPRRRHLRNTLRAKHHDFLKNQNHLNANAANKTKSANFKSFREIRPLCVIRIESASRTETTCLVETLRLPCLQFCLLFSWTQIL